MMHRFIKLFLLALVLFGQGIQAQTLERISASKKMTIAFSRSASPFSMTDAKGQPIGYAIELCTRVATAIQRELKLSEMSIDYISPAFTERLQGVREGRIDMECGNTINTAERRKTLGFSLPVYLAGTKAMVRTDLSAMRLTELAGKRFGVIGNSAQERLFQALNERYALQAKAVSFKTSADAFSGLKSRDIDAVLMSDIVLYDFLANATDAPSYRVLQEVYAVDPIALVVPKEDVRFKALVDRTLSRLMSGREIHDVYAKWFEQPIPPKGINLQLKANYLTRDHFRRPSDAAAVGDGILVLSTGTMSTQKAR
jgi:glutamate/aspartate transport system substrate-binding protein